MRANYSFDTSESLEEKLFDEYFEKNNLNDSLDFYSESFLDKKNSSEDDYYSSKKKRKNMLETIVFDINTNTNIKINFNKTFEERSSLKERRIKFMKKKIKEYSKEIKNKFLNIKRKTLLRKEWIFNFKIQKQKNKVIKYVYNKKYINNKIYY